MPYFFEFALVIWESNGWYRLEKDPEPQPFGRKEWRKVKEIDHNNSDRMVYLDINDLQTLGDD